MPGISIDAFSEKSDGHFMQAMVCPFRKDYQYFISVDRDKLYLAEILVNYIYS